jgi:hypothetical protein
MICIKFDLNWLPSSEEEVFKDFFSYINTGKGVFFFIVALTNPWGP